MTYPEMNEKLVALLRISDDPSKLYAADRIEELERENAELKSRIADILEYIRYAKDLARGTPNAMADQGRNSLREV